MVQQSSIQSWQRHTADTKFMWCTNQQNTTSAVQFKLIKTSETYNKTSEFAATRRKVYYNKQEVEDREAV